MVRSAWPDFRARPQQRLSGCQLPAPVRLQAFPVCRPSVSPVRSAERCGPSRFRSPVCPSFASPVSALSRLTLHSRSNLGFPCGAQPLVEILGQILANSTKGDAAQRTQGLPHPAALAALRYSVGALSIRYLLDSALDPVRVKSGVSSLYQDLGHPPGTVSAESPNLEGDAHVPLGHRCLYGSHHCGLTRSFRTSACGFRRRETAAHPSSLALLRFPLWVSGFWACESYERAANS